ncbi:MAG: hypothetical protein LBG52_01415 [Candidatus Peribacteria bacterium]|nr:hypothetical protein [Candidatus Peribacteria bacterium]
MEEIGMNKDTPEAKSLIQYEEIGNILDEYDRKFCKIEQKIDYIKEGRDKRERSL